MRTRRPTLPPPYPSAPHQGGAHPQPHAGGPTAWGPGAQPGGWGAAPPPVAPWPQPPRPSFADEHGFEIERVPRAQLARMRKRGRLGWTLFLGTAIGGAGIGKLAYDERTRMVAELRAAQASTGELVRARDEAMAEAKKQRGDIAALEQKAAGFADKAQLHDQQVASEKAIADANAQLVEELKKGLEGTGGQVAASEGRVVIAFAEDVLFAPDETTLGLAGFRVLYRVGKVLKGAKERQFVVDGTGAARPLRKGKAPWELSAARAVSVARFLVDEAKLDPTRVSASAQPASKARPVGRKGRLEIVLAPLTAKSGSSKPLRKA